MYENQQDWYNFSYAYVIAFYELGSYYNEKFTIG